MSCGIAYSVAAGLEKWGFSNNEYGLIMEIIEIDSYYKDCMRTTVIL